MLERIDHLICVTPDLAAATAAHERLGLVFTLEERHAQTGAANRACFVGNSADSACYLELLSVFDAEAAKASGRSHYVEATERGGGVAGLGFGVTDVVQTAARLEAAGLPSPVLSIERPDGSKVCDVAWVETGTALPFRISVIEYPETWDARYERSKAAGRFDHTFPLKRLDHLAAVAPDLEAATRYWGETLGVPVFGEIRAPQLIIRQLKIGDAILELLGPAGPDSPMASRPASLASMAAWEVSGSLDDAVALARQRGFTVSDAEAGVIPGTRRASIPAGELGGIGMQLLEYV
jgi:catechol 2,3-dioxygenase-like lactoylglutathione lyase family enzyme